MRDMSKILDGGLHKPSGWMLALESLFLVICAIAAKTRAQFEAQVPEGYEDATGFHFGAPNFKDNGEQFDTLSVKDDE